MKFSLRGENSEALDLDVFDTVGAGFFGEGVTAKSVRRAIQSNQSAKVVNVRINSNGGDVLDGFAIFAMLSEHPGRIVVDVVGIAASIASFIAMAGNEIRMAPNSVMMIHNPWGVAVGEANDMRAMADVLDKFQSNLANTYAMRSGQKRSAVLKWMNAETYFTAEEAKANGFADKITGHAPSAAAERKPMQPQPIVPQAIARAGLTSRYAELAKKILAERDPVALDALLIERDSLITQAEGGAPRAAAEGGEKPYHLMTGPERHVLARDNKPAFTALRDKHYAEIRRIERELEDALPGDRHPLRLKIHAMYQVPTATE